MERPSPETVAAFETAFPDDPRAVRGQMFGHPCGFVNGNMFFGTFGQTLVARVGETRTSDLVAAGARRFEPMEGRTWRDYVQVDAADPSAPALAREALTHTATLPPKEKAKRKAKR